MADSYETRTVTAEVEFREETDGPVVVGHAATFNQPYQVGFFTEQIHRDAFKRTLAGSPDVRLLVDHGGQPLARTKSGTLTLGTDDTGLTVRAALDPTDPDVQRLVPKMRRGDMDQMSFAFRVPTGGDVWDHSGDSPMRTIREANLSGGDVSIVTYPANENASVALRKRETRDAHYTLAVALLEELREGRAVDTARLTTVLQALASADVNIDASLTAISDMLGVPNPDADGDMDMNSAGTETQNSTRPLDLALREAARLAARRK